MANKGVGQTMEAVVDGVLGELLPRYAELQNETRTCATTTVQSSAVVRPDSMFIGAWRGLVRVEAGELPLDVDISEAGVVRAKVGRLPDEREGRARKGNLFVVSIPGGLDPPDTTSGRSLAIYLRPRDGVLNGVLTTFPPSDLGLAGRVSYWVELRRRR